MTEENPQTDERTVDNGIPDETKTQTLNNNYDVYDTDIKASDFSQGYDPNQPWQTSTENDVPPEKEEGDEVKPDANEEKNVLDLEVVPDEPPPPPPQTETQKPEVNENLPRATVIYRAGWGARPQKDPPAPPLSHPIDSVIFLHTGQRAKECHDVLECSHRLQELQRINMYDEGMPDIQYNFMVASDSTIYEGRGWFHSASKDLMYKHYDGKSLDICFIGDFSKRNPPPKMVKAGLAIVGEGIARNYIKKVVNFCRLNTSQAVTMDFGAYMKFLLPKA